MLVMAYLAELAKEPVNTQLTVLRHRLGLTHPTVKMVGRAAKALGCRVLLIPEKELGQFLAV